MTLTPITAPDDPAFEALSEELRQRAPALDTTGAWPGEQLELCGQAGVFRWFFPTDWGGLGWSEADLLAGYVRLAAACLTTTFVITQRMAACSRLLLAANAELREELVPELVSGRSFATVGISHLSTSRRHLGQPVLRAREAGEVWVLEGYSPWVTGAAHAAHVVIGAVLDDQRQILAALPTQLPGISLPPVAQLVALTASHTGPLVCEQVQVPRRYLMDGPVANVMQAGGRSGTGGLSTSALAIGLAQAALQYLEREAERRRDLSAPLAALRDEWNSLYRDLLAVAQGNFVCPGEQIRARANSLALRATQAALSAAKGTGFVLGHPVGRWCREALFFLVWSCPQPVAEANLCELAGISPL